MSKDSSADTDAIRALRLGLEMEMRFIDTAEMYAKGHSEEVVAEAVGAERESVFIATKVSPENLKYDSVLRSCESSLKRLRTGYVDLYQVHWPNSRIPIRDTMRAMEKLMTEGKIRHIGVSNFSKKQTREAQEALSKSSLASNQVEYSLLERSIEKELLPYCTSEHVTIIAYTPLGRGSLAESPLNGSRVVLDEIASKYCKTGAQIALNWLIAKEAVVAIPKATNLQHIRVNAAAAGWRLSREDERKLDESFR